jgi:phage gpG-like protein
MSAGSRYASKVRSRARAKAEGGLAGQLQARLEDLAALAEDSSPMWDAVGQVWAERQRQVFATASFGRWTPLKYATILDKRRMGRSSDPLVRTGVLREEVSSPRPRASSPHFVILGPQRGAAIEYARYHLHGNGVPQRNPVPRFSPAERTQLIDALRDAMGIGVAA